MVKLQLQNTKTNLEVSLVSDLQRKFRGMLARRQVFEKLAEPSLEEGVTDLQRAFRGMQARRDVKTRQPQKLLPAKWRKSKHFPKKTFLAAQPERSFPVVPDSCRFSRDVLVDEIENEL